MLLSYLQVIALAILQGVTELFPVSSLGHSVILPQLLGWSDVVAAQSATESYFLAFLVGLHVATALALLLFYRATWARIARGLLASLRTRRIETPDQRLGWLLVVATIPAGIVGLLLEHTLRVVFARPLAASTRDGDRLHENVGEHFEGKLCLAEWRRYLNASDHWLHALEHLARDRDPFLYCVFLGASISMTHPSDDLVGDCDTGHFVRQEFRISN